MGFYLLRVISEVLGFLHPAMTIEILGCILSGLDCGISFSPRLKRLNEILIIFRIVRPQVYRPLKVLDRSGEITLLRSVITEHDMGLD